MPKILNGIAFVFLSCACFFAIFSAFYFNACAMYELSIRIYVLTKLRGEIWHYELYRSLDYVKPRKHFAISRI